MIEILLASFCSSIILYIFGYTFLRLICKKKIYKNLNFSEFGIFGIIFLSFYSLFINFFFPIDKFIGTITLIISLVLFLYYFLKSNSKKLILKNLILISLISFVLITHSNVNRPDAGLYHLPIISMINESKIIFGSVNINFRFGQASIVQYLSGIYNNHIFSTSNITLPLATLFAFFIVYATNKIYVCLNRKENYKSFIIFLITIFSLYSFNRYSNFGNDMPAHIYFFILIIFLIDIQKLNEIKLNEIFKISLISIYLFALKPFMVFNLIVPIVLFLLFKNKNKLMIDKKFLILNFLFIMWVLKSIITSGCIIYPLEKTCIKSIIFYDHKKTTLEASSGEAWAKDWVNQEKNKEILNYENYNKNFNWISTWRQNHFKKVLEKILPFLIILFLVIASIFSFKKSFKLKKIPYENFSIFYVILSFSFLYSLIWFFKFPLYRYGISFLVVTIIFIVFILLKKYIFLIPQIKLKKIYLIFLIIGFSAFFGKNFIKIYKKIDYNYTDFPWPQIYSLEINDNKKKKYKLILGENNESLYYYSEGKLCMYSKSPCSNFLHENLKRKTKYGYYIYWIN